MKKTFITGRENVSCTEVEFLDEIYTKVLRVFLLAIHSHIYTLQLQLCLDISISLKVHKNENFFGFDFEFCTISVLVMHK